MSGKKGKKNKIFARLGGLLLLLLLAVAALLLFDRGRQGVPAAPASSAVEEPGFAPEPTPGPTPAPTPTPEPTPTPCAHLWSGGVCEECGEVCAHETHDAGSAVCLACGLQRHHHYEQGVCTGCGREPLVYTEPLPDEYYTDAEHAGTRRHDVYTYNGGSYPLAIWLPWDYSEDVKYNVILLMPGDKSYLTAWIDMAITAPNGKNVYCMSNVFDHIAEEHLCDPFIAVGISNYAGMNESVAGRWICEGILPYLAENYSTWAEDGSSDALKAAREHFAIGGLSRGSIQTYDVGMNWCLEYMANFACFSNISNAEPVARRLNSEAYRDLSIRCYYATWGIQDEQYNTRQEEGFHYIVDNVERLNEGENAFSLAIDSNHSWDTWSTSFFNAIQYLF